jgi:citrate lyase subunit beta/citryl-CoA lyase/(S)-citramalyl-CoA lyase
MSGKAAIHPRQVAAINSVFSPDAAELERARKIVAQAEASKGDICVVEGTMIGIPIVEAARRTLGDFGSSQERGDDERR